MPVIAYVQMDAFGILILFFFWTNQQKSGKLSLDDRIFNGILIAGMVEQLMDIGQWALDGVSFPGSYVLQVLSYSLGYIIAPVIMCLWVMYCDLRVYMDEQGLKRRVPWYLLPILLNTLLVIVNLFSPLLFQIDSAHIYHRDRFFLVYMVLMYLYGFMSILIVIRKAMQPKCTMERTEFRYMALFIVPSLIAGALQWMFYGLSIIWMSVVLSIILVYTNVLSRQILTDPLTGLNNRRKLNRFLGMQINSLEDNQTLFMIVMDADEFKQINDQYGHAAGDRALMAIADILKELCREQDCFLSRLGGDEFLMIGHNVDELYPQRLSKQIDQAIERYNKTTQEPFRLSLSTGWARFHPQKMNTIDALLNAADQSMYQAKRAKRTRAQA